MAIPTVAKSRRLRSTIYSSRIEKQGLKSYTVYTHMLLPASFSDTLEDSYFHLKEMISHVSKILEKLELPFRLVKLCGGDLSFTSSLTYDFEVYSAAQERWLEVSSVSNSESFQANRLKLRYKDENGKNKINQFTLKNITITDDRIEKMF